MNAKPWQIAVIVIGLLGGSVLFAWNMFGGERIHTKDEVLLMDVISGDRFIADVSGRRGVLIPARNPDTRRFTLLPLVRDDNGQWRVDRLDQLSPEIKPEDMKAVEDPVAGVARPSDAPPRRLD